MFGALSPLFLKIISFSILALGLADDLRSRKIHNKLIYYLIPVALLAVLIAHGPRSLLYMSAFSGLMALALSVPLFFLKVIGGGDVKLFFAFALTLSPSEAFWAFVLAFPAGLLMGFLRLVFQGRLHLFLHNMLALIQLTRPKKENLQSFPFSAALLMGWLLLHTLREVQLL